MKRKIRITESEIKRLVRSVLYESLKYSETVKDGNGNRVENPLIIAQGWRDAVLDKLNGGPGACSYGGREYSISDWQSAFTTSKTFMERCMNVVDKSIGGSISDISKKKIKSHLNNNYGYDIDKVKDFKTDQELQNDEFVQNMLHDANVLAKPDNETIYSIALSFFWDPDIKSSLTYQAEEIVSKVKDRPVKEVLAMLQHYLEVYTHHKYREWLKTGGDVSSAMGNVSLSTPVTNEKNIDYVEGDEFINSEAERNKTDMGTMSPDDFADMGSERSTVNPLKKLKYMLGLILNDSMLMPDPNYDMSQHKPGDEIPMVRVNEFLYKSAEFNKQGKYKEEFKVSKVKYAIQFMYDHFDEIFDMDEISKEFNFENEKEKKTNLERFDTDERVRLEIYIRNRVSKFLYNAYQRAYEANDKSDYVVNIFGQFQNKPVVPKSAEQFSPTVSPFKYMWKLISTASKSKFAIGNFILNQYNEDESLGLVSERRIRKAVRSVLNEMFGRHRR